ncbi:MAG: archaemetzincin family Zn-dependent metalloprotease [Candidatus Bathyarchaeia archaeon]|jgi:archaemetzincin
MKIGILSVGQLAPDALVNLKQELVKILPDTDCTTIKDSFPVPKQAFDKKRSQYNSSIILDDLRVFIVKKPQYHRVLGVIDADIFASGLNYVFGEAYVSGRAALISLWRLKPQFYRENVNITVFVSRMVKEAVHELGHTLGLQHCSRSFCVMHFSNSIFDTDKKQSLLCDQCYLQTALAISNLG